MKNQQPLFEISTANATSDFIICRESTEEFLAEVVDQGITNRLAWTKEPMEATRYESPDHAAEAKRIAGNMKYPLSICEIHTEEGKTRLRFVS